MNYSKVIPITVNTINSIFIFSVFYVSVLSLLDPQATMNLVDVQLENNDALSSIRGIYGGAGLAITIGTAFLLIRNNLWASAFYAIFWGGYALSRIITIFVDGPLGAFGNQWLTIELLFCSLGILCTFLLQKQLKKEGAK
ncbi:MAG: DUF4345 domain-containing protein [Salibacteraceae bacterium]